MSSRRLGAAVVLVLLVAGGAVWATMWWDRRGGEPVVIDAADVPFSLLRDVEPTVDGGGGPGSERVTLFFVYQDALVAVERFVPRDTPVRGLLERLFEGPTEAEIAAGLTSLLDPEVSPSNAEVARNRAMVDFGRPSPEATSGERRDLALAQIVYTMTALDGVRDVRFLLDGQPAEVPIGDGTLTRAAVTRADYPVQVLSGPS